MATCKWCGNTNHSCTNFQADGKTYELCDMCINELSAAKKGYISVDEIATNYTDPTLREFFIKKYADKERPRDAAMTHRRAEGVVIENAPSGNNTTETPAGTSFSFKKSTLTAMSEEAILQIAQDVRFLRNVVLASIILTALGYLISFIITLINL